jgi:hypothetical protein
MGSPLFHTFLTSLFFPRAISLKVVKNGREKSKQQGKPFFKKYTECDLEAQIATHTNQDT